MSRRTLTHFRVDQLRQDMIAGIVYARLLEVEVDRRKRIDRYIDYFGSSARRRINVTLDPCGESLLDGSGAAQPG